MKCCASESLRSFTLGAVVVNELGISQLVYKALTGFPGSVPVATCPYELNFPSKALQVLMFASGC